MSTCLINFNWQHLLILIVALSMIGCSEPSRKRPPPTAKDYEIKDYLHSHEHELKLAESYSLYPEFSAGVAKCTSVELFEGLPHDLWESNLFARENEKNETVGFGYGTFYAEPITLSIADASHLMQLYCLKESFVPYRGVKSCGGFHADWGVRWKHENRTYEVNFCFGCCEMTTWDGTNLLYCDMWDQSSFEGLLNSYRKNRPPQRYD